MTTVVLMLLAVGFDGSNDQSTLQTADSVMSVTGDLQPTAEQTAAKFREHLPFPLQQEPTELIGLGIPCSWPELPTQDRAAAILAASVDDEIKKQVEALPGDAIRFFGTFFYYGRDLADAAERIAKDVRPEVDRTLLSILDDPGSELLAFRLAHHLLAARNAGSGLGPLNPAIPIEEAFVADLSRPVDTDRSAVRAYWHVVLGESEFLPDYAQLLRNERTFFLQYEYTGRMFAIPRDIDTLFLLRCNTLAEAYAALEPLLHDEERFAAAHMLLGIKMRVLSTDAETKTYLGLRIVLEPGYSFGNLDPDGFNDVQQWWKERREAEPEAFEKLEEASKKVLAKWAKLREKRRNLLAP